MSSAISTDSVSTKPIPPRPADDSLQPWQFFVLAALACATAVTFIVRGQGITAVVLLTVLMAALAFVGLTSLRTVLPLTGAYEDRTSMIGERTRAALEREKLLTLRAIKELEFDRAMGKLSEDDFREMSGRLRVRAAGLIRQLDAGAGYRTQVEKDLEKRLRGAAGPKGPAYVQGRPYVQVPADVQGPADVQPGPPHAQSEPAEVRTCAACETSNDPDAKFCKSCGQKL